MGAENSFLIASIAASMASVCVVLSLWSFVRLGRVEAQVANLDTKLPPKRVQELQESFSVLSDAWEQHQQKNQEWKQSVHGSVQRMDQVMRRNEKATSLLKDDGTINEEAGVAAPAPDLTALGVGEPVVMSKQESLRKRWQSNRGL